MLLRFLIIISIIIPHINSYANPGPCLGDCACHDPYLIQRNDGTWYRFRTGDGIGTWTSKTIEGPWEFKGEALPAGSSIPFKGNKKLWAPDITLIDSLYYMYYSISIYGSQNSTIGVATSSTLEPKSWTDLGEIGITSDPTKPYNAIDSNLIRVGSNYYLNFGSHWGGIFQTAMSVPPIKTVGKPYNLAYNATGIHALEGSSMFYHSGWYYLLYSSGYCCGYDQSKPSPGEEYRIVMCRSKTPTSGFVDKDGRACSKSGGSTLLASHGYVYGPGGQGVTQTEKGLLLYYHYINLNVGISDTDKTFGYNYLSFENEWPVV